MDHVGPLLSFRRLLFVVACLCSLAAAHAQNLPGLSIQGTRFSYQAPDGLVTGSLIVPDGVGPYPAVLLSHGRGGSGTNFMNMHGLEISSWGVICIAVDYTHAGQTVTEMELLGYSPENSRRARRALDIVRAIPTVDPARLAAFGHSMGAFMTLGLAGETNAPFGAICAIAGGSSGVPDTRSAAPGSTEVAGIVAPTLLVHGELDTVVPPAMSKYVYDLLKAKGVAAERQLYQDQAHDVQQPDKKGPEIHALFRDWLSRYGVLRPGMGSEEPTTGRLLNLSVRARTGSGDAVLITGFVIGQGGAKVIVRAVGPSLAAFGVTGLLRDPELAIFDSAGRLLVRNQDWSSGLTPQFQAVGMFPLTSPKEAALEMTLPAGAYTVHVTGQDGSEGVALTEIYEVP